MAATGFGGSIVRSVNNGMLALMKSSALGGRMGGSFVEISYVGRRSGKTISTPVNYRRSGDDIVIAVMMPDKKSWWRNFLGEGAPITLHLNGGDRTGHAVSTRDEKGAVSVKVVLDKEA